MLDMRIAESGVVEGYQGILGVLAPVSLEAKDRRGSDKDAPAREAALDLPQRAGRPTPPARGDDYAQVR